MLAFMAPGNIFVQLKISDIFLIFAPSMDCLCSLEQPRRGDSNEFSQSMF